MGRNKLVATETEGFLLCQNRRWGCHRCRVILQQKTSGQQIRLIPHPNQAWLLLTAIQLIETESFGVSSMEEYSEYEYIEGPEKELPCGHVQYLYVRSGEIVECGVCARCFMYRISIMEISDAQSNDSATINTRIGGASDEPPKSADFANPQDVNGNGGI